MSRAKTPVPQNPDNKKAHLSAEEEEALFKCIWWLRKNPVHAAFILFGLILAPHQRMVYRGIWKAHFCGLRLSRGMSKTTIDGLFLVQKTILYANARAIVLGKDFRRGKIVFNESIEPIITSSLASQGKRDFAMRCLAKPNMVINRGSDLWITKWRHNSVIATGPLGQDNSQTSPLRGLRANAGLVIDEAADITDEHYTSVIRPFGRVARDPVGISKDRDPMVYTRIESGTVRYDYQRYTRFLLESDNKMRGGDRRYFVIEFNYEDAFFYRDNDKSKEILFTYILNLEDLFEEYNSGLTSLDDFLSENKNVIQLTKGREFPPKLIESVTGANPANHFNNVNETVINPMLECDDVCAIGFDPARESADAAFVVIRVGALRDKPVEYNDLIYAKTLNQAEFGDLYKEARDILKRFPNARIFYMDQGGGGSAIRDMFWRPNDGLPPIYDPTEPDTPQEVRSYGVPILRLDQATAEKNTFRANFTKGQMESHRFLMPEYTGEYTNDLDDVAKTIRRVGRQFTYIVSKPVGNWKKYEVGERRLKKDLFSATLLAMQGVYDLINDTKKQQKITNEYAWL